MWGEVYHASRKGVTVEALHPPRAADGEYLGRRMELGVIDGRWY